MTYELRELDDRNKQDVAAIARLHLKLLPQGPMANLGEFFLGAFCYTVLVRAGLMRAALALVDGRPVGFVAYSARSITFHRTAIRKHLFLVAGLVTLSIFRQPAVLLRIPKAIHLMFSRRAETHLGEDPLAEILAIGVLPEYLTPQFVRRTGVKISRRLVSHAASYFSSIGLDRMRMIVEADNRPAILFYHTLGARFEPYQQAGEPMFQVWLELEELL